jgi:hypothetical protein
MPERAVHYHGVDADEGARSDTLPEEHGWVEMRSKAAIDTSRTPITSSSLPCLARTGKKMAGLK